MTKRQRNTIYRAMLKHILRDPEYLETGCIYRGFCDTLRTIYYKMRDNHLYSTDLCEYPELVFHKPKRNIFNGYWFDPYTKEGTDKRIEILLWAIAETSC